MKHVTRDIDPAQAQDLLERAPRACLAFAAPRGPQLLPVELAWQEGRFLFRLPGPDRPAPGQEAVLLVDEGVYYFDLRAVYIRGQVRPAGADPGWVELVPDKTVAWDYGALREGSV